MSNKTKRRIRKSVFYIIITVIVLLLIFPLYWMLVTSVQSNSEYLARPPVFVPTVNIVKAYSDYIQSSDVLIWFRNTLTIGLVVIFGTTILAVPAAYAISRFKFKGRSAATFAILITQMLPIVFILIPVFIIFSRIGFTNNLGAIMIIDAAFVLPVSIWFMKGFCDGVPKGLEEAAQLDGCNHFQALQRVILPLLLPGIAATATWALIIVWDEYLFSKTFINSSHLFTFSIGLAGYIGQYDIQWNKIMIGAVLSSFPVALLFMFLQKYLVGGLTAGAVKG